MEDNSQQLETAYTPELLLQLKGKSLCFGAEDLGS